MFSRRFCVALASAHIVGVLPWCLMALIVKYSYVPYRVSRISTKAFGGVLLLRAWLGPEWVVKITYAIRWLLTVNLYRRDEIGNAFIAGESEDADGRVTADP